MNITLNFIKYLNNKLFVAVALLLIFFLAACSGGKNDKVEQQPANGKAIADTISSKTQSIIFFGNSLTAGYGVDPSEAFPALIQNKIDSLKLNYKVINAGVSGETSAGGDGRVAWILRQPANIFILELGGNDGLRGIALSETKKNLQSIINKVKATYPECKIVLAGMQIPPNLGQQYAGAFKAIYPALANKNNIALIPFLLQNVGGDVKLNQQDGIHPTAAGHKIVAENVWSVLKNYVNKAVSSK